MPRSKTPAETRKTLSPFHEPRRAKKIGHILSLFDEMVDMLDLNAEVAPPEHRLPAEPLPGLLEQCISIAEQPENAAWISLAGFPGTPPLEANWWQGVVSGIRTHVVKAGACPTLPSLDAMQREASREGQDVLLLTSMALAEEISLPHADPQRTRVILCHPWRAYMATGLESGQSLDTFCAALLRQSMNLAGMAWIRYEDCGDTRAERAHVILGRRRAPANRPLTGDVIDHPENAPAYEALCAHFGYDPTFLPATPWLSPPPHRCVTFAATASSFPRPAQISWLLPLVEAFSPRRTPLFRTLLPRVDSATAAELPDDAIDALFATLGQSEGALAALMFAAHYIRTGDSLLALGLIAEGAEFAEPCDQELRFVAAALYLEMNRSSLALDMLTAGLRRPGLLSLTALEHLQETLARTANTAPTQEHGHELLIERLHQWLPAPLQRRRLMVEIGSTRESLPEQGSTRKLAMLCAELDIDFITVDMDPSNSKHARRMFKKMGLPFEAVTARGEAFLADFPGPVDYVFLDAYDFDHGQHSERRQLRYERYMGDRINDKACHQMHLDCVISLVDKLADDGLICFDDTWRDPQGAWTAKGTTAMPFLLDNGFELIEARHRASLLRRSSPRQL